MYSITFAKIALRHVDQLERSGAPAWKKFKVIYEELKEHPRSGTGRPEKLRHIEETEVWSRRLDKKNRLTYSINDHEVHIEIISALGHYDDK